MIASVVIFANVLDKNLTNALADEGQNYWDIGAEDANLALEQIAPYTIFDEDLEEANLAMAVDENKGFLNSNEALTTDKSKLEKEYIVQKGDTISSIANKFNMHVASILDRNSISAENSEKISAGQNLTIPAEDTSDSQDWLAKVNQKKEQERQLALKKAQAAKKKTVALSNRSTIARDRSGYSGVADGSWARPISYKYISRGISRGHTGIDMVAGIGTPVYASKSGKVTETTGNWGGGYGNSIVLDHGSGQTSRYAHLSSFAVGLGDYVSQGQLIAYSGNTGWSTGPHLHFEARINGTPVNPF